MLIKKGKKIKIYTRNYRNNTEKRIEILNIGKKKIRKKSETIFSTGNGLKCIENLT